MCGAGKKQQDQIQAYTDSVAALDAAGILVVAAAGNEQQDNDQIFTLGYPNSPCNVQAPNVISVGATDRTGALWAQGPANPAAKISGSNRGSMQVDMGAPGSLIVGARTQSQGLVNTETRYAILESSRERKAPALQRSCGRSTHAGN